MIDQPTPEEIRRATFKVAFRGFDQAEVEQRLDRVAAAVEELRAERDRMAARLGDFAERDLEREFEHVGREVTAVLEAARQAAESMRERAAADASRWRSEATVEAERVGRTAREDAEALRTDAWTTGTQLLEQVQAEIERIRSAAERDALSARGEAEREAHRLTSSARREADDLVRGAKMEAEKLVSQARAEHDDVIATAHRQAEAAQERTRALEQRRQELMAELESVRATLSSFEEEIEGRRQGIGLSDPPELPRRAVVSDASGTHVEDWEEGHTVRIIHPGRHDPSGDDHDEPATDAEALAEEVARLRSQERSAGHEDDARTQPAELPDEDVAPADEVPSPVDEPSSGPTGHARSEVPSPPDQAGETAAPARNGGDDLSDLFQRLRSDPSPRVDHTDGGSVVAEPPEEQTPGAVAPAPEHGEPDVDVFEVRERLLLPLTNSALRSVKRALTEAQNQALEQIRLSEGEWSPDPVELNSMLSPELDALVSGAAEAGREAAVELGLTEVGAVDPSPVDVEDAGVDLARAVAVAIESAEGGTREKAAAASRVFRGWRTDEAERRVRAVAMAAYHSALRQVVEASDRSWKWVAYGRLCPSCRSAAERGEAVPPAHRDCNCTILPV